MHNLRYTLALSVISLVIFCTNTTAQNKYPSFYSAPKESYVKNMKLVFEDIHSRKWEKAQKDYAKLEEKSAAAQQKNPGYANTQMQALYPLPQLAMSILYSTENTMVPSIHTDYSKAYTLLKQVLAFPDRNSLNAFLLDPNVNVNLNMLEDRIEDELCKRATTQNTEQAYDAVIDSLLPQSLRVQTMKSQREELVYAAVHKSPTEKECVRFLTKYGDALLRHRKSVSHQLDSIRYYSLDGTVKSLQDYIKKYPESSYLSKAQEKLEDMEYKSLKNNSASYRSFMEKYPSSKYLLDVKKRLTECAYKEAIADGTAAAYQRYCTDFPYDLHYQNVFDSLLTRNIRDVYAVVFAGKEPDDEKVLSSTFYEALQKREAAEKQLIEHSLVPPRRRNMWTGLASAADANTFNHLDIKEIDIKSKTTAAVHIVLSGAPADAGTADAGTSAQADIFLDFIFEGTSLKLDDIRLDNGNTSQKYSLAN